MRISDWSSDVCSSDLPPRCDMIAISAHKVHGPKGIGALWLRDDVALTPVIHGGGQEGGLRSGTLSPALCAGFGAAARLMRDRADGDRAHAEQLWTAARRFFSQWTLNRSDTIHFPGNQNPRRTGVVVARLFS